MNKKEAVMALWKARETNIAIDLLSKLFKHYMGDINIYFSYSAIRQGKCEFFIRVRELPPIEIALLILPNKITLVGIAVDVQHRIAGYIDLDHLFDYPTTSSLSAEVQP